jgi:alanine dehydrogenase
MLIGVPTELKEDEHRVGLTPAAVRELAADGHRVVVERGAGLGSACPDEAYLVAGAELASVGEVWERAELVIKVKEPLPVERSRMREGQILFTYLHLAADRELTQALIESGAICIAYETVQLDDGALALEKPQGGRGVLLGGIPGVLPANVVVIGGGTVGSNAALIALGMHAQVLVLERSVSRMRYLELLLDGRVTLAMSNRQQVEEAIATADLVIGAVLVPGARAPTVVTRDMLGLMHPGSVIVDVAIDQGGSFETSRPTTHSRPLYEVDGIVHYCVANIPGAVPITSTKGLVNVTLPYVQAIAGVGLREALQADGALARGVNVAAGTVTHGAVARAHGLESTPLETALDL